MFTSFANFATQIDSAGADALVLFTRFHKIDIDVIELEVVRRLELSNSSDLDLRLRGMALLAGRVKASLAITGGAHSAIDVIKGTMAGAHVIQLVSALMRNGPSHIRTLRTGVEAWMEENEWNSLDEMRGNMSFQRIPNPSAYETRDFQANVSATLAFAAEVISTICALYASVALMFDLPTLATQWYCRVKRRKMYSY